jgi:hypothetical protein
MLTLGVVILRNNACSHTATHSRALLDHFNWEVIDHPPYGSDLALRATKTCLPT